MAGVLGTAVAQGAAAAVGFALFGVPYAIGLGALTSLLSFLPGGTLLTTLGAAAWLAMHGGRASAGGMLLWGLLVVGTLGSLAQPLASPDAFWPVVAAGIVGAGVPTVCYIAGIRRLGPPRAAILATFEPVVGVALAAWLLGEQPAAVQLLGGALILVAAVLLQLRPSAAAAEHEAVAGEAA